MSKLSLRPNVTLEDETLLALLTPRVGPLLALLRQLSAIEPADSRGRRRLLTRPFVSISLSQTLQIEELLDAYGAANNARWHDFRQVIAALKLFSHIHYLLLHLQLATPGYQLPPTEGSFEADTDNAIGFVARVLQASGRRLLREATTLGFHSLPIEVCPESLPAGRLPQDRQLRQVTTATDTIARLASAFLNLSENTAIPLKVFEHPSSLSAESPGPNLPSEADLRNFQEQFHNLQALYDTHLSNTDAEAADPSLRSLRGHASVLFHLLEVATELAHFIERHCNPETPDSHCHTVDPNPEIAPSEMAALLHNYPLRFAALHIKSGRDLAQTLLRRYSEPGEILVPVPRYRGFHVRPSTLVARIVFHYGSAVTMTLEEEIYDASSPLELFRANERVNAHKRRWLADEIVRVSRDILPHAGDNLLHAIRQVILTLVEESKIILYEQPIPPLNPHPQQHPEDISPVVDEITRLQALGKIDIQTTLQATFRGDRRVLRDLEVLATHGYGEDAYGNNVALPKELAYLRNGP